MWPKISIITPCFNSEAYIEQTITSVVQQTYDNIEYIIVDGASTDRTMGIVSKYQVDRVISEPDEGIYDALNKGVEASTGDYILCLNSDDYLIDQHVIQKVVNALRNAESPVQAIYGNVLKINESNGYAYMTGEKVELALFKKGRMPSHQGIFIRRELFVKFGLFDRRYRIASDFDFVIKVFKEHMEETVYLPEVISVFRLGGLSTNVHNRTRTRNETLDILSTHFSEFSLKPLEQWQVNIDYYKRWIEVLLFKQKPISTILIGKGINNVAIFGSTEMSLYVYKDLELSGIKVLAFLDNDKSRQGIDMNQVRIEAVEWLRNNGENIDAIIFAFEGSHDDVIKRQINEMTAPNQTICINWKEIVASNL